MYSGGVIRYNWAMIVNNVALSSNVTWGYSFFMDQCCGLRPPLLVAHSYYKHQLTRQMTSALQNKTIFHNTIYLKYWPLHAFKVSLDGCPFSMGWLVEAI